MNKEYKPTGLVSMEEAIEALDDMDDYARMETGVNAYGPRGTLTAFIEQSHQNPNPISAMYHIVRGLVLELESIHKALGFEDAPINTKMMVESIDRLRQINIMTEEDELAIDTLLNGYENYHIVDNMDDGVKLVVSTATKYTADRLKGLLHKGSK